MLKITTLPLVALALLVSVGASAQQTAPATAPATKTPAAKTPAKPATGAASKTGKAPAKAAPAVTLKTQKDKFSYAVGMNIASSLKRQPVEIDPALLARGIKDAFAGGKTLLTEDEVKTVLTDAQNQMRQKQQEKMQAESSSNQKAGEAFLAENKAKEGVVTLPDGLQYKILTQGTGPKPTANDTVVCNYRGTLIDGKEFDSSYKRGQPATFPVGRVIKGWTEALPLMPVGSKWQLFIPSSLAYGERGAGQDIGPNSTLIFEVELLSIQPPATAAAPAANPAATNPAATAPKQ
jgi:FKBP-type peptidyl-prolyl cis-trans isomerase FklB